MENKYNIENTNVIKHYSSKFAVARTIYFS